MSDKGDSAKRGRDGASAAGKQPNGKPARSRRAAGAATTRAGSASAVPIVAVGASAGGLEALIELLSRLAPDTGLAFVIIQHLAPSHPTILPEILARHTKMPVVLVENNLEVKPNSVYIIAPGSDMTVSHGHLNLTDRSLVGGMHLPVDHFLRSLATDLGPRAIGVILSDRPPMAPWVLRRSRPRAASPSPRTR